MLTAKQQNSKTAKQQNSKTAQLKTAAAAQSTGTRVVMLGTGHPGFDSKRAGQAILIVVDKQLYLFDSGPGYMKNWWCFKKYAETKQVEF